MPKFLLRLLCSFFVLRGHHTHIYAGGGVNDEHKSYRLDVCQACGWRSKKTPLNGEKDWSKLKEDTKRVCAYEH